MFALFVLAILATFAWKLWASGLSFAQGFRSLLERPTGSTGFWPFFRGVETVGGEFQGRPTLLVLHHKRGNYMPGYLVVAMQASGGVDLEKKYEGAFREWIREPAARAAWDDLELEQELKLTFNEGWMRATWQPHGAFIFPGQFDPERWRRVLRSMDTVLTSLE